ncbi:inorganic polyphosphate kinase [Cohnella kolymensis]|uniref:NAD kinase n=1 Tax=Cohnella kolymensis TaxID=1590652 RepID=A0ABR5A508_9BACL|nr:NAD kinase [Cohnella kolymensis]KIL36116.1 inorganic polyphosphate kinase [Cohnella kolymensis]
MKYALLDRGDRLSRQLCEQFHTLAKDKGFTADDNSPDVVISIGGDGTLLQAFHRFKHRVEEVSFIGIHTGHLGFYADWKKDEIADLLELMKTTEPRKIQYPLLRVEIQTHSSSAVYIALNEFSLKSEDGSTFVAGIHINDEPFETFRGDGIVISTPSGSTGYNKSLGGAVIHPSLEALQITEMASINNRVYRTLGSPVILPKHHHCDITPDPEDELAIGIDHLVLEMSGVRSIVCKVAEEKVSFARYRPYPFWNRVREAFIGSGKS